MADSVKIKINGDNSGFKKSLSEIGNIAKTGLKVAGVAVLAVGAGIATITTMAVKSFAEYEQLVGGVDTLFKNSSQKVQEYADNAYMTAGMSANKYMETVTGFSASLLQSLKGDTVKAAEAGNQAVIDMSDNANKMGTSMESIQFAYQGFAKQNYTMLDNLKLGYGGTKGEMERLLADAQKISGVKYNIDNLNDVYSAIHVIQTELGITGTTALEAGGTISGSFSATKASFDNLITGMANKDADIDALINNFVESVGVFAENLLPVIETALSGIADVIAKLAPIIAEKLPALLAEILPKLLVVAAEIVNSLVTGIIEALPQLIPAAVEAISTLITGISDNLPLLLDSAIEIIEVLAEGLVDMLPEILEVGIEILVSLIEGLAQTLPELIPLAVDCILTLVDTMIDNIDMMIDAAIDLIMALADGLIKALPILIEKAPVIIEKLVSAIVRNLPKILKAGMDLLKKLIEGIAKNLGDFGKVCADIVNSIVSGITKLISKIWDMGSDIVKGLWKGIQDMSSWLTSQISGFFTGVIDFAKNILGIHSPSKVFAEIGKYTVEGFAKGIKDNKYLSNKAMKDIVNDAIKTGKELEKEGQNLVKEHQKNLDNLLKTNKANIAKIKDDYKKELEDIDNMIASRANQLANPSSLFGTGEDKSAQGFINDMQGSKDKLVEFNSEMNKIMDLNISDDMKAEFQKLGVDSLDQLKIINSMTSDELYQYMTLWQEQQDLAKDMAERQYKQAREEAKLNRDAELEEEAERNQKAIDKENKRFDKECKKLRAKVDKEMSKVGSDVAKGLAKGIAKSKQEAINEAQKMADAIKAIVCSSFEINSPSKAFMRIGNQVGDGLSIGLENSTNQSVDIARAQADKIKHAFSNEFLGIGRDEISLKNKLKEALGNVKAIVNGTLSSITPQLAVAGGYGANDRTVTNTTTNAPVINFNQEIKSPDVVSREIDNIFTHRLAGAR